MAKRQESNIWISDKDWYAERANKFNQGFEAGQKDMKRKFRELFDLLSKDETVEAIDRRHE